MRFLCDEMLKGLARWLRIAGYDAALAPDGTDDRLLVERAVSEGRLLLSRDRSLLAIREAARAVVLLNGNELEGWVHELRGKLAIDWLHDPFTRCSLCNTRLVAAERPAGLPEDIAQADFCVVCAKYYWCGGHVKRMRARLERWQAGINAESRENVRSAACCGQSQSRGAA